MLKSYCFLYWLYLTVFYCFFSVIHVITCLLASLLHVFPLLCCNSSLVIQSNSVIMRKCYLFYWNHWPGCNEQISLASETSFGQLWPDRSMNNMSALPLSVYCDWYIVGNSRQYLLRLKWMFNIICTPRKALYDGEFYQVTFHSALYNTETAKISSFKILWTWSQEIASVI